MYPILEIDKNKNAIINPQDFVKKQNNSQKMLLCFFQDEIQKLAHKKIIRKVFSYRTEMGSHNVYLYEEENILIAHPGITAPLTSILLEQFIARGITQFMVCGSCGVLDSTIKLGQTILVNSAIRDEGTSYHYLAPSREIAVNKNLLKKIENILADENINYIKGKTWTTDAFFRETPSRIKKRKEENAIAVEMEAAALLSVSVFRNIELGYILYAGDDISQEKWHSRKFTSAQKIRENLLWLTMDILKKL